MKKAVAIACLALLLSCTDNERTRIYGGTVHVDLKPGEKLVNLTWKETSLWILVRKMHPGEGPERYVFREVSQFGVMQGQVLIQEKDSFGK